MELIQVSQTQIGQHAVNAINAKELHEKLEVKTKFVEWMKRAIEKYGFEANQDFISFLGKSNGGRPTAEYVVTLDMAKELCMIDDSKHGKEFRKYFLECEAKAHKQLTIFEQIQLLAQGSVETLNAIKEVRHDVELLKNTSTLDYAQQLKISQAVGKKVASLVASHILQDTMKSKLFSGIYSEIKKTFEVASYKDIAKVKFETALTFIDSIDLKRAVR